MTEKSADEILEGILNIDFDNGLKFKENQTKDIKTTSNTSNTSNMTENTSKVVIRKDIPSCNSVGEAVEKFVNAVFYANKCGKLSQYASHGLLKSLEFFTDKECYKMSDIRYVKPSVLSDKIEDMLWDFFEREIQHQLKPWAKNLRQMKKSDSKFTLNSL